ncbi:MAG TPA: hypothetical protein VFV10_05740 [Gammaproteobacteria bacterium]|nr:hypothetical protein [Gammaproteobacteria bacterium]
MRIYKLAGPVAVAVIAALGAPRAHAQFGAFPATLPQGDFTWNWGHIERKGKSGLTDFSVDAAEAGFRCNLQGKLSPGSRMTEPDMRQLESDLRTNLYFIEASVNAMNTLDYQRDLDWATLDCDKIKATEDPEKTAASLQKAKDKAVKKLIERREKREREEAKAREQEGAQADE